jgi:hypothetical protein
MMKRSLHFLLFIVLIAAAGHVSVVAPAAAKRLALIPAVAGNGQGNG